MLVNRKHFYKTFQIHWVCSTQNTVTFIWRQYFLVANTKNQGDRSWQPFGEGENADKKFRQARICYLCDTCVLLVGSYSWHVSGCPGASGLGKLTTSFLPVTANLQIIPCNNANIDHETLFLSLYAPCCPFLRQIFQKVRKMWQILISQQNSVC